ncbi:uncharacterized protein BDZ99DRAFT_114166 [Mytilinidion resinicola]|uniref:Uncharacterized protein n=1 Tax=Mytilinidion resinicola TaxID=574789 RepID=A0A6A6Y9D0_9PEZI|nr:uncharacterized protein BDZ99DRAFT_114166 [Mytilinidion resinicola]KAF2805153.1 hypothetical protein BDZ99DRAFT_114166 [Mytilinidion resinicola]
MQGQFWDAPLHKRSVIWDRGKRTGSGSEGVLSRDDGESLYVASPSTELNSSRRPRISLPHSQAPQDAPSEGLATVAGSSNRFIRTDQSVLEQVRQKQPNGCRYLTASSHQTAVREHSTLPARIYRTSCSCPHQQPRQMSAPIVLRSRSPASQFPLRLPAATVPAITTAQQAAASTGTA